MSKRIRKSVIKRHVKTAMEQCRYVMLNLCAIEDEVRRLKKHEVDEEE